MGKRIEINEDAILAVMEELGCGSITAVNVALSVKLERPSHTFRIASSEIFYGPEDDVQFRRYEIESAAPCSCHDFPAL